MKKSKIRIPYPLSPNLIPKIGPNELAEYRLEIKIKKPWYPDVYQTYWLSPEELSNLMGHIGVCAGDEK